MAVGRRSSALLCITPRPDAGIRNMSVPFTSLPQSHPHGTSHTRALPPTLQGLYPAKGVGLCLKEDSKSVHGLQRWHQKEGRTELMVGISPETTKAHH